MNIAPLEIELRNGRGRLRVEPRDTGFLIVPLSDEQRRACRWSAYTYVRRIADDAVLDSAKARARLRGDPAVIANVFATGEPVELLVASGLMVADLEDERWEFHDALFHQQSSRLDPLRQYGATWRLSGRCTPPVATEIDADVAIPLPDPAARGNRESALAEMFDERRSATTCGDQRLAIGQIGRLLALSTHRLPSAGGLNELRFYLVSGPGCADIQPAVYLYHQSRHTLVRAGSGAERILERARLAWASGHFTPQALVLIAAQVPIQAWKYEGIAYRNTMLDCGIALEALYLSACAVGLGGCALGWNDPLMLCASTGIPVWEETAMASFVVCSQRRSTGEDGSQRTF
jgi:SagB-type dehydrogenase family enzyme